jgi:hypothetical protein
MIQANSSSCGVMQVPPGVRRSQSTEVVGKHGAVRIVGVAEATVQHRYRPRGSGWVRSPAVDLVGARCRTARPRTRELTKRDLVVGVPVFCRTVRRRPLREEPMPPRRLRQVSDCRCPQRPGRYRPIVRQLLFELTLRSDHSTCQPVRSANACEVLLRSLLESFASTKRHHVCLFSRMNLSLSPRTEIVVPGF